MSTRAATLSLLVVLALVIAGCGEQRDQAARTTPTPLETMLTTPPAAVATVAVSLTEYSLTPSDPRVRRAGLIAFVATNDGQRRHALRVDGPAGEATSETLAPGERTTIVLKLPPGTYKWYGPLGDDEERGMVGRVRVAE
ncbi:MAG: hypothetical protein ACR2LK_13015 [Solirubrobacteraceae bacterium]